nr:endonuclease/exonuclease/phosphatase family protein [Prevotella sp.]
MKKQLFVWAAILFVSISVSAQKRFEVYAVGFYNQENLFDTCHDEGKKDYDFLPNGSYHWDGLRYKNKLQNMAQALHDMGTDVLPTIGCAMIG